MTRWNFGGKRKWCRPGTEKGWWNDRILSGRMNGDVEWRSRRVRSRERRRTRASLFSFQRILSRPNQGVPSSLSLPE